MMMMMMMIIIIIIIINRTNYETNPPLMSVTPLFTTLHKELVLPNYAKLYC